MNQLLELFDKHSELTNQIFNASSPEEALQYAQKFDSSYTLERLEQELEELAQNDAPNEYAELDLEQLNPVAGGVLSQKNKLLTDEQMERIHRRLDRRHNK